MVIKEICQTWIINLYLISSIKVCTAPSNSQGEHLTLMRNYIVFRDSVIFWFALRDLPQTISSVLFRNISWISFITSHRRHTSILCEVTVLSISHHFYFEICVKIGLSFPTFPLCSLSLSFITYWFMFPWILLNLHFTVFLRHPKMSQKSCES